jgi:hypothetical protein
MRQLVARATGPGALTVTGSRAASCVYRVYQPGRWRTRHYESDEGDGTLDVEWHCGRL